MSEKTFSTVNPVNLKKLASYTHQPWSAVEERVSVGQKAFLKWRQMSLAERKKNLLSFKEELLSQKKELARLMSLEMGKPLAQAVSEVEKCAQLIDFCTSHVEEVLRDRPEKDFVKVYEPLGIIYGIMPWNFPVWQTLRFAIPALLAGNVVLVKPADSVAGTGVLLESIFAKTEALSGVYTNISITHDVSDRLISHPLVRGVSFTGSSAAGRKIAAKAGEHLKKTVLELGGNDAYIVLEDADVAFAARRSFEARILNAGQSCISAKRLLVHEKIKNQFVTELRRLLEEMVVGDPLQESTRMGPVARVDQAEKLHEQVRLCVAEGAVISYQKNLSESQRQGAFFPPTILTDIRHDGEAMKDEIFGPVFLVSSFSAETEAITLANNSPYGLGGAVFTKTRERAERVARALDTGSVALNDYFRSSPERPFGGVKDSGYGRELGREGFFEFVNLKVLVISGQVN